MSWLGVSRTRTGWQPAARPSSLPLEVVNALLSAECRGRISETQITRFLDRLTGLSFSLEAAQVSGTFDRVLAAARKHGLSSYDASYLELALRQDLPLATLDKALRRAARAAGVAPLKVGR